LSPDNTQIVVEKTSDTNSYDDFLADLPPNDCRYAVYDFEYEKGDEGKRNKLCFYAWSVALISLSLSLSLSRGVVFQKLNSDDTLGRLMNQG
jgi:hypothetical protein